MFENPHSIRTKKQNILNEKVKPFRRYSFLHVGSLASLCRGSTRRAPCTISQAVYFATHSGLFPEEQSEFFSSETASSFRKYKP